MTSATQPVAAKRSFNVLVYRLGRAARTAISECRWFLAAVCAQMATSAAMCGLAHEPMLAGPFDAYSTILAAAAVFGGMAVAGELFERRLAGKSRRPLTAYREAWRGFCDDTLTLEYLFSVALILSIAPLALSAFSAAKQALPAITPFAWDARLAGWGATLDGGRPLWQHLQPVLGKPRITVLLDGFYHRAWTTLLLATFVWTALSTNRETQQRFLVSFVLVFLVVGNILALAWSSAGPPYLAFVAPSANSQFAGLFAYLRSVDAQSPLLSVRGQHALWSFYTHQSRGLGFGISAMPSVHVASGVLVALFGFRISRVLGTALSLVAVFTFISSVALGWHYALDGYVGAIAGGAVWWLAGRMVSPVNPQRVPASHG